MKLAVISTAPFIEKDGEFYGYSPLIKELDLWAKHAGEIAILCPIREDDQSLLVSKINFKLSRVFKVHEFDVKSFGSFLVGVRYSIRNFYQLFQAMRWADHIHLRCPGNISLMGCIVQIFFPSKIKTAKYAGNWDPDAKQPLSYKIQKRLLSNTLLTRNMKVMVYGQWPGSTKNIKPFFTATYREADKIPINPREMSGVIKFMFVGTLANGKRPEYAIGLVQQLKNKGQNVTLDLYGDGNERQSAEQYVEKNSLGDYITFHGNQPENLVREAYQNSHFLILPSKSEGWPKAVAEAMFWGCVPIATKVSCVPYMLGEGSRGILLDLDIQRDSAQIISLIENPENYNAKVSESVVWSRQFTLDLFEKEIKQLLNE